MRIVLALLSLLLAVAPSFAAKTPNPFASASFAITLPANATATKTEGPDFDVYYVKWGDTGILGIYEGCCPQTFLTDADALRSDVVINGQAASQTLLRDGEQTSRELYIKFEVAPEPGSTRPAMSFVVHAWYEKLGEIDAKTADDIIATIRPKPH